MALSDQKYEFYVMDKVKQSRVGHHVAPIVFQHYATEPALCVVTHLKEYIERTKDIRNPDCKNLLISFVKPHKAVSRETISH